MKRILSLLTCFLMASILCAHSQERLVTGVVISTEDHLPIIGANILIKETKRGTATDIDGRFELHLQNGEKTIIASYLGMVTLEIPITDEMIINLSPEENLLNEVIVIGYGAAKKRGSIVGAVSNIASEKLQDKPVSNVLDALQGAVSGLNILSSSGEPSATPTISLRGVGSLTAGNEPLIVLDGVPISDNTLNILNSNDFESVTVLKDASATSIYGSRASNGVILITSKRGRTKEQATINLNTYFGTSTLARKDLGSPMNANQLLDYQLQNEIINQAFYDARKAEGYNTNWRDFYFDKHAPTYNLDLSIGGGTSKTIYYLSAGYFDQKGTAPGSWLKRYTGRMNLETQLREWMRVGTNLTGSYSNYANNRYTTHNASTNDGGLFASVFSQPYYSPINPETNKPYWEQMIPGVNIYNPRYVAEKQPNTSNKAQLNGTLFVELRPLEGLTVKAQLGLEAYDLRGSDQTLPSYTRAKGKGYNRESFERLHTLISTNTAEYTFHLQDKHHVTALVGHEGISSRTASFAMKTEGHTDDRLMLLPAGTSLRNPSQRINEYAYLSYFSRLDYNLDNNYFLNFSARRDGSSRFGIDNQWATFFSAGFMVDFKKALLDEKWPALTQGRIKGSIGSTGNSSFGNYASYPLIGEESKYNERTAWGVTNPGNEQLTWEKQISSNIGLSLEFFQRIKLDLNAYVRTTKDMLMYVPVESTTGFSYAVSNVGKMENRGVEVELLIHLIKQKEYYLDLKNIFSFNKNRILELYHGKTEIINLYTLNKVGYPQSFYLPVYKGVDPQDGIQMWELPDSNGEIVKNNNDLDIFALNQPLLGKSHIPTVNGGFSLEGGYKGFSLRAEFAYVLGKYMLNTDRYMFENTFIIKSGNNGSSALLREWRAPNDITDIPRFSENKEFDSRYLENASFLRLKNFSLSYQLPESLLKKSLFVQSIKIHLTGRNLWTLTKYKGSDPEIPIFENRGDYPNSKQLIIGANITF